MIHFTQHNSQFIFYSHFQKDLRIHRRFSYKMAAYLKKKYESIYESRHIMIRAKFEWVKSLDSIAY